jgi:DNA-binding transcriptional ArsR family regulator
MNAITNEHVEAEGSTSGNDYFKRRGERFVKIFTGSVAEKLAEAGGKPTILLMHIIGNDMLDYGTNYFHLSRLRKVEIMNALGLKMGAIYKSLRRLKDVGLIEMHGMGCYAVNKRYFEYGNTRRKTW